MDWAGWRGRDLKARSDHQCHQEWKRTHPFMECLCGYRMSPECCDTENISVVHSSGSRSWEWADLVLRYTVHPSLPANFLVLALEIPCSGKFLYAWKSEMVHHTTCDIALLVTCQSWILANIDLPLWASFAHLLIEQDWKAGPQTHAQFFDHVLTSSLASSVKWEN